MNPDLSKERKSCTFNTQELTNFLDGGPDKTKERRHKESFFLTDPELTGGVPLELLSHEDQYRQQLRKEKALQFKLRKFAGTNTGTLQNIDLATAIAISQDASPLSLHKGMFLPTLKSQGTDEQQAYWVPKAESMEIIGTYAQTELGHGTFIRGLETTATYEPNTEQFVLNSPTLTSYKWWPGGLGHTCNHAIVLAQLYTKGQCHGIHPFIVQLRDVKTHQPLAGITVGEIGRKMGMNSVNNGFLKLGSVRIPRKNMLMRNAQVLQDGTYLKSANSKLTYGAMVFMRVFIVNGVSLYLSKAVTIGVRYSAVRRQSEMRPGEREPQILDYQTQQYKLFPYIAFTYAFRFAASWLNDVYKNVIASITTGNLNELPELHVMACCLKAVCTSDAATAVETIRLACGGHGYMSSSGLPQTYVLTTAMCTYEGENTVMLLQTARGLVKACAKARHGERLWPTTAYLGEKNIDDIHWSNDLQGLVRGFKRIACAKVSTSYELLEQATSSGLSPEDAWNQTSVQLVQAAEAHCRAFLVERYVDVVQTGMRELSPELRAVMLQLCELYCVYWTLLRSGDFLLYAGMGSQDIVILTAWQTRLLAELRPNAVGLVDSFDYRDEILGSTLGAYDGQVYERLIEAAMKSPLNAKPVHDSFHASIAPLLKAKY